MRNGTSPVYSAPGAPEAIALREGPAGAVRAALLGARERTLRLAEDFRAALGPRPQLPYAEEVNPPLWELGHVAWFQEWWLLRNPQRARGARADPAVARPPSLLPSADAWYDSSKVGHRRRWELPLPGSDETADYLRRTLEASLRELDALPPGADADALYFFRLCALHEQMHAEAAVYMGRALGIPVREDGPAPSAAHTGELKVAGGPFTLGAGPGGFAFDNELPAHAVEVAPFTIDAEPVSWSAFLPFVEEGGYEDPQWWTPGGRAWLAQLHARRPAGLRRSDAGWELFRQGEWQALALDEAATHLSAHEAEAWCHWAGRRLPTESEWECAALTVPGFRWGQVWEWTASRFEPYPGFAPHPYQDYSRPWFGTRRVLRGASPATAPALAHVRYRNFFEPQRRDIFSGFRTVRVD